MLNKVILIGRLTRDPELRYTQTGIPVANFSIAVDRRFTGQGGERETDFIDIVAWRKLAELCANHLGKGRLVAVDGSLQSRSYETNDGQKRKAWEVVADNVDFLDRPREGGAAPGPVERPSSSSPTAGVPAFDNLDLDDDVPF